MLVELGFKPRKVWPDSCVASVVYSAFALHCHLFSLLTAGRKIIFPFSKMYRTKVGLKDRQQLYKLIISQLFTLMAISALPMASSMKSSLSLCVHPRAAHLIKLGNLGMEVLHWAHDSFRCFSRWLPFHLVLVCIKYSARYWRSKQSPDCEVFELILSRLWILYELSGAFCCSVYYCFKSQLKCHLRVFLISSKNNLNIFPIFPHLLWKRQSYFPRYRITVWTLYCLELSFPPHNPTTHQKTESLIKTLNLVLFHSSVSWCLPVSQEAIRITIHVCTLWLGNVNCEISLGK